MPTIYSILTDVEDRRGIIMLIGQEDTKQFKRLLFRGVKTNRTDEETFAIMEAQWYLTKNYPGTELDLYRKN